MGGYRRNDPATVAGSSEKTTTELARDMSHRHITDIEACNLFWNSWKDRTQACAKTSRLLPLDARKLRKPEGPFGQEAGLRKGGPGRNRSNRKPSRPARSIATKVEPEPLYGRRTPAGRQQRLGSSLACGFHVMPEAIGA